MFPDWKGTIVMDVDGTFFDNFKEWDKSTIQKLFKNSAIIKGIDSVLWMFNGLDLFTNSATILKLRLKLYSVISGANYKKMIKSYAFEYDLELTKIIVERSSELAEIKSKYNLIFITSNPYGKTALKKTGNEFRLVNSAEERYAVIDEINKEKQIDYLVGNNYMDDIAIAKDLYIASCYIGSSPFVHGLLNFKSFKVFFNSRIKTRYK